MSTDRKLRVATVITRFNGGAGQVALNGMLALPDGAYERAIVTGGVGIDSKASGDARGGVLHGDEAVANAAAGDLTPRAHTAGMEIVQVGPLVPQISPRDDLAALRTLERVLREGRYDVVHTHSAKGGVIGRVAAARAGVPRIVHTWHGFPFNEFQSWARRRAYIGLERIAARRTDAFLAIGSETVTTALRLGLTTPDRVRLSWPAVDVAAYAAAPGSRAQARRRLDLPLGVKVVGSVGRLTFQKGPEVFAKAIARLPGDVFGLWVGGGPMADELAKLTDRLGIGERMRWLGHRDDVAAVLPAFDVLAMASRWEGLPCVLVEAIGAGIPLVATAVPSNQDLVLAGETGMLVRPEDPAGLAAAITVLLDDPVAAARMAARARERVGDWFSPAHLGTVLDETYRGGSRRP
ncbi:glycosyltransferase [Actinomadura algeriensis]|uniref:Glycosyltransferase involved in cell wall biosynthesis n=1 Tax=Actinomadura algeriensis TaxID=1679523 RepID=A0ABR9JL38_9ACTN|nr:glycosyltransferase [Actinomadura algeriensis]MBE1531272.1 glycosyltransferase involved in cell wall biosynthesis [Actinomadura algeriensis]